MKRLARQRGLTLTELAVTTTVLAVALAAAVSSFTPGNHRRAAEGVGAELRTDLHYMRATALMQNRELGVSFYANAAGTCYLIHSGSRADCSCEGPGPGECHGGAELLKSVFLPAERGISVLPNSNYSRHMAYSPVRATISPTGRINVTGADKVTVAYKVNLLGRVSACSATGELRGYKPC